MQMTPWKHLLLLLILMNASPCKASSDYAKERAEKEAEIHQRLVSTVGVLKIWWAKPANKTWTKFKFIKLRAGISKKVKNLVKSSTLSENAGNYYTLDRSDNLPEQLEGVLLFIDPRIKEVKYAYRFDFRRVHKKGLRRMDFISCDFKENLKVRSTGAFWGILLKEDIAPLRP